MFQPGAIWYDTAGQPIQAHGGGVLYHNGVYYWYGENKAGPTLPGYRVDVIGVSCYSSRDLYHWTDEGVVLPAVPDDPAHDLHPSKIAERPKVLYNARTGLFVLWLHTDSPNYQLSCVGVATSVSPTGPFEYRGSFRPNDTDSRDMTIFQDEDGRAYLIYTSDRNSSLRVADLSDDYLSTSGYASCHFVYSARNTGREAPALFKHQGRYFLLTSGSTGWLPNPAECAVAESIHGPWHVQGNPCLGAGADTTFGSQSTFVLPVAGQPGAFIAMFDRWNRDNLGDSRYVWLPVEFDGERPTVRWYDTWDLTLFQALDRRPALIS